MPDKLFAFVLMPFDPGFDDVYKVGIKETAEKLGIVAERVDEQTYHSESILARIYNQINAADFVIADMTGRNPNVFYEVGYAHAKEKLCVLLTQEAKDIPFDLSHHRHIIYGDSIIRLRDRLESDVRSVVAEIEKRQHARFTVELTRATALLDKNDYMATAKATFAFDFHNRTPQSSPEIEAVYFYSGSDWSFELNGQACHSIASDIDGFRERHFLQPPVKKLHPQGWARLSFKGKKHLWFKWNGELQQEKYRVAGKCLLRVSTSDGSFDFPFPLDMEVEDLPF